MNPSKKKRAVRALQARTGLSYTAARRALSGGGGSKPPKPPTIDGVTPPGGGPSRSRRHVAETAAVEALDGLAGLELQASQLELLPPDLVDATIESHGSGYIVDSQVTGDLDPDVQLWTVCIVLTLHLRGAIPMQPGLDVDPTITVLDWHHTKHDVEVLVSREVEVEFSVPVLDGEDSAAAEFVQARDPMGALADPH